ncbi:MAG TPA: flippase [Terriglobales bacterium]|nr:flippase [Terriglobales bacterium]
MPYTSTSLSRVVSNTAAAGILEVVTRLFPLITFPLVVRALGPEVYGNIGFAVSVNTFFGLLASPGFTTFGMRAVARDPERARSTAAEIMGARLVFAAVSYLLLVAFTFTLAPSDPRTRTLILLSGLSFLVSIFDLQWLFLGRSRVWSVSLSGTLAQIAYTVMIVALVRTPDDAWVVPTAAAVSGLPASAYLLLMARSEFGIPRPVFSPSRWFAFLPVCLTLGLASVMSFLYDQIDTVMLRYLRSEHELGLYVASYRIMAISMSFLPVMGRVFFPLLSGAAGNSADSERRYLTWMAVGTVGFAVPIAVGGLLLATPLSVFVLGPKYAGAEALLRWLMLNLIAGSLASFFSAQLIPHNREGKYIASVASGAAINVALNLVLIPAYGARAAVWTTILSQLTVARMSFHFSRDLVRPKMMRPVVASIAASAFMACAVLGVRHTLNPHVTVVVAIGALVYAAFFYLFLIRFRLDTMFSRENSTSVGP